jgi:hypothetical protein
MGTNQNMRSNGIREEIAEVRGQIAEVEALCGREETERSEGDGSPQPKS